MPIPSPGLPLVRAKIRSYWALWMPVFHVFSPLMTHSSPSRSAWVSMKVASEPCSGSVMPKAKPRRPSARSSIHSAFCSSVPYSIISSRPDVVAHDGVLVLQVAVEAEALGRQVLADHGHAEVGAVAAAVLGRERVAVVAGGVGPPAGLGRAAPPTRRWAARRGPSRCAASSRRWSKKRMLSSACSSGLISRSMNSSSSVEVVGEVLGEVEVHGRSPRFGIALG